MLDVGAIISGDYLKNFSEMGKGIMQRTAEYYDNIVRPLKDKEINDKKEVTAAVKIEAEKQTEIKKKLTGLANYQ